MVSHVESCYADTQDYGQCLTPSDTGLALGSNDGEVEVASTNATSYVITAHSKSTNDFMITKSNGGAPSRSCTTAGKGACKTGGLW
jgi:hypothetical protein